MRAVSCPTGRTTLTSIAARLNTSTRFCKGTKRLISRSAGDEV